MKRELRKKLEALDKKMEHSPNKDNSHFLYRRERMIRLKMALNNYSQKLLAKRLGYTESYISKLIIGDRYNKDFDNFLNKLGDLIIVLFNYL